MCNMLRRLFLLALLGGAGYAVYTALKRRGDEEAAPAPVRPRFDRTAAAPPADTADRSQDVTGAVADLDATAVAVADADDTRADDTGGRRWVEPVDGQCPEGFPIKGNDDSGIYHVPGGRFYDRTVPERCYANEDDAVADGYRRSKA